MHRHTDLKQAILARIRSGEWPPNHRLPSESALVEMFGVSKVIADRAMQELAREGEVDRVRGIGSFVASRHQRRREAAIPDLGANLRRMGLSHDVAIVKLAEESASKEVAQLLATEVGASVFRSVLVHTADRVPILLEDRYVLPAFAPNYLQQNFAHRSPFIFLAEEVNLTGFEHAVEAAFPKDWERKLLILLPAEPCLGIFETISAEQAIVSSTRFVASGRSGAFRMLF